MGMTRCLECETVISDQAISCPRCGKPTGNSDEHVKKKKSFPLIGFIVALLGAAGACYLVWKFLKKIGQDPLD